MSKLATYLNQHIVGNVFDRPTIRESFATDRSILQVMPRLVAQPANTSDIRKLVRFSNQLAMRGFELPIAVRGTGLDKTGATLGDGLVISMAQLDRLEELDARGRLVRVQPGITLGSLNSALSTYGLCLPIDYHPDATVGGLIANCVNDDLAGHYGGIYHFVERAEVVLSSGDIVQFAALTPRGLELKKAQNSFESALYRKVDRLLDDYIDTIVDRGMRPFDAAGYANVTKVRENHRFNLLPLLFAAQGTLGIVTDVILRLETVPVASKQLAVIFEDWDSALRFLNFAHDLEPASLKLYDLRLVHSAARHGHRPEFLESRQHDGWLVLARFDDRKLRAQKKIQHCQEVLPRDALAVVETAENVADFQELQSIIVSFLNDTAVGERLPILDDVYIPAYKFGEFLQGLKILEQVIGLELPVYGSFMTSNYHVRPELSLASLDGRRQALDFLKRYGNLVLNCEGSLTGGSPEGRTKILPSGPNLPEREQELYRSLREIFDPQGIFNPHLKLGAEFQDVVRCLRTSDQPGIITA